MVYKENKVTEEVNNVENSEEINDVESPETFDITELTQKLAEVIICATDLIKKLNKANGK